ncbi:hypothetical protein MO973_42770 [Paenibacillus sp. TRM 82003]|nr:hypothetical protein [Paenibacillus sp. TRM 82003]
MPQQGDYLSTPVTNREGMTAHKNTPARRRKQPEGVPPPYRPMIAIATAIAIAIATATAIAIVIAITISITIHSSDFSPNRLPQSGAHLFHGLD